MTTNETIQNTQADMFNEELSDLELDAVTGGANSDQAFIKPAHVVTELPVHGGLKVTIGGNPFDRLQGSFAKHMKQENSPRVHRPRFEIGY